MEPSVNEVLMHSEIDAKKILAYLPRDVSNEAELILANKELDKRQEGLR